MNIHIVIVLEMDHNRRHFPDTIRSTVRLFTLRRPGALAYLPHWFPPVPAAIRFRKARNPRKVQLAAAGAMTQLTAAFRIQEAFGPID